MQRHQARQRAIRCTLLVRLVSGLIRSDVRRERTTIPVPVFPVRFRLVALVTYILERIEMSEWSMKTVSTGKRKIYWGDDLMCEIKLSGNRWYIIGDPEVWGSSAQSIFRHVQNMCEGI